jgi:hypothetical protein
VTLRPIVRAAFQDNILCVVLKKYMGFKFRLKRIFMKNQPSTRRLKSFKNARAIDTPIAAMPSLFFGFWQADP